MILIKLFFKCKDEVMWITVTPSDFQKIKHNPRGYKFEDALSMHTEAKEEDWVLIKRDEDWM